ncbi:hypothetical protein [Sulfitobacter sp. 1A15106]|uniref:hypothetical protein n=1 Tax=Sulfitobacter sp. 1A15106 TaxID=3368590 RepID=UPI003745D818
MAGSPDIKVFDADGKYQAACKEIEAAAALMGFYGEGATIRFGHAKAATVWTEGKEDQLACESYDHVAQVALGRQHERNVASLRKSGYSDAEIAVLTGGPVTLEA